VKHRGVLVLVGLAGALALIVSLSVATAGGAGKRAGSRTAAAIAPPAVPGAKALKKKYGGQKITFVGDAAVGSSHKRDLLLVAKFKQQTGINVSLVPHPAASDASYQQLARNFSSKSSSIDVAMLDVVWVGAFAAYLENLKPALGKASRAHAPGIIQNNTIGGKLVAMPWFGDFGILYYRTDLLKKYGYSGPPKTWARLFQMAKKIQDGERKDNDNFYGFVFQGNSYEGLTCDALEWIASAGGGHIIDNGKVTINNAKARAVLDLMRGQIGKTTPRGVTTYQEGETHNAFVAGNAAFMRNWPYAYSVGQGEDSKVKGKFSVTVLPHGAGTSVGTVGGWQLGVSKFSKHKGAATAFVGYMTSPGVEKFDAIYNTNVPTILAVARDKAVVKANPYLKPEIANVARVTRPSKYLKTHYNEGSKAIYQGINQILNGAQAKSVLPSIESKLKRLIR
jgi:trehalose/maltose transport system substrate-binding protein